MATKCGRSFGDKFVKGVCANIPQARVLELGPGPTENFWAGDVETVDMMKPATHEGYFEDLDIEGPFDVFASSWSIAYGYDPGAVIRKAIKLVRNGGHILIITRTSEHNKENWVSMKWLPTRSFLTALESFYEGIELIESDETEDGEFFAGLWRVVR